MVVIYLLVASLLYSGSFQPIGFWFLAPIAYAILIKLLISKSNDLRSALAISFLFAFIGNAIILHWSGAYVGAAPWLLLALLQGLYYLALGYLATKTQNIPLLLICILVIDEVKSRFPFGGFGWTRIAFSQVDSPFSNLISLGGVSALSAIVLVIATALISPNIKILVSILGILIISSLMTPAIAKGDQIKIRAVQGGVPEVGLNFNQRALEVMKLHIAESKAADDETVDVVIWPENAIDIDPFKNEKSKELIQQYLIESTAPLIAGAVIESEGLKNVTIKFSTDGSAESIYQKRYLTPFGEYMPLRSIATLISPLADSVTDFSPGQELITHSINGHQLATVICYEILNDGIVREAALKSEAIIVHTNSATFFGTAEGEQQLAITRLRAIEHRRSIVSVSTTGPSAVINSRGEVTNKLLEGERAAITSAIALNTQRSPSDILGSASLLLVLLFMIAWSISFSRGRK